jgi:hypothetical protein
MTIVLTLPPEVEMILQNRAHHQGQDIAIVASELLEQVLLIQSNKNDLSQPSKLKLAALNAIDDYLPGSNLLAFESLDGEDFQSF